MPTLTPSPLVPEVVTDTMVLPSETIADVAEQLYRLKNLKKLETVLLSGELITRRLYDGDPANLHRRDPRKAGLRALAAHPMVTEAASTLHAYVAVYGLTQRVQLQEAQRERLSYSHYREVLAAPEDDQRGLLERAATGGWTVKEMRQRAQSARRQAAGEQDAAAPDEAGEETPKAGPTAPAVVKAFKRTLTKHRGALEGGDALTDGLTQRRARRLASDVRQVITALEALEAQLEAVEDAPMPEPEPVLRPEPAPRPQPDRGALARPTPKPARPAPSRPPPTARAPSGPGRATASVPGSDIERRLEDNALLCWRIVEAALKAGVLRERLARVVMERTRVSAEFAERVALLADLPPSFRRRLERWPELGREPPDLTAILDAARLE